MENIICGCHLSVADGYAAMGQAAASIAAGDFQFFTRNPRSGMFKKPSVEEVRELSRLMRENGVDFPLAHAPYTFNPCGAKESVREYTWAGMAEDLDFLDELSELIPNIMYNFHPGSHTTLPRDEGISLTAQMLNRIVTPERKTMVLIETMAGKGSEICGNFEEIREVFDLLREDIRDRVGVCMDTCHVHDAGYDIGGDPEAVLEAFDRIVGLHRLRAVHLNDSMNPLGAKKDRHEKLGKGYIGAEGITRIINAKSLRGLPLYLETPNDLEGYGEEIKFVKEVFRP